MSFVRIVFRAPAETAERRSAGTAEAAVPT